MCVRVCVTSLCLSLCVSVCLCVRVCLSCSLLLSLTQKYVPRNNRMTRESRGTVPGSRSTDTHTPRRLRTFSDTQTHTRTQTHRHTHTHTHTHTHRHTHTQSMGTLACGWAIPRLSMQCAWDCVYDVSRNLDTISLSACVVCMRSCGTDGGLGSGQEGPLLLSARRTLTHVGHVCHGLLGTVYRIAER